MPSFTLDASQGARLLSGEFDYLVQSGSSVYYSDSQGVSSADTSVAVGSSITRRGSSWVISAGQSNIVQSEPATISSPSAVPTGAVETQDLQDSAVTAAKIATGAVTSAKILDGEIVNADVKSSAAIAASKLAFTQTTFTQTYATADPTHAAPTATALTSNGTSSDNTLVDVTTTAVADPVKVNANFDDVADEVNKLITDLADAKQMINSLTDCLQANGIAA